MARALRKWLLRHQLSKPADLIVNLTEPVVHRNRGQHIMALGCVTVLAEISPELLARGVRILEI
ncbi:MAG TPA: hypothetical protein VGK73_11300 [Polyangiaceae bacterium]